MVDYRYELRRGAEVVATGRIGREEPFELDERVEIAGYVGVVRALEPTIRGREVRLLVEVEQSRRAS